MMRWGRKVHAGVRARGQNPLSAGPWHPSNSDLRQEQRSCCAPPPHQSLPGAQLRWSGSEMVCVPPFLLHVGCLQGGSSKKAARLPMRMAAGGALWTTPPAAPVMAQGFPQSRDREGKHTYRREPWPICQGPKNNQAVDQEVDGRQSGITGGTLAGPGSEAPPTPHMAQKPLVPLGQALPF